MKKFAYLCLFYLLNATAMEVEKTDKKDCDLEVGKEYLVLAGSLKNEKVKLLEIIAMSYKQVSKNSNVHHIVTERIKYHPERLSLMEQLEIHRKNSSLSQFFEQLAAEIKEPIYYIETQQNNSDYVEAHCLKPIED